eukprot:scaffold9014_cov64-Phaeocystis_antarctica.AAC.3
MHDVMHDTMHDAKHDDMHLVGTHERGALVEASRLRAGDDAAAADATGVEGGARRGGARRPAQRVRRAWRGDRGGGSTPLGLHGVRPGCRAPSLAHDLLELGQINPA